MNEKWKEILTDLEITNEAGELIHLTGVKAYKHVDDGEVVLSPDDIMVAERAYIPTFPEAWNKLCPQGWAWLIGSCDFGQNCGSCTEEEAPIYAKTRGSSTTAKGGG